MRGRVLPFICLTSLVVTIPATFAESGLGLDRDGDRRRDHGLECGTMDETRVTTILAMGVLAYAARVLPQVLFVGKQFPEAWDRFLRYLSYSFICGIISNTLFVTGARITRARTCTWHHARTCTHTFWCIGPRHWLLR